MTQPATGQIPTPVMISCFVCGKSCDARFSHSIPLTYAAPGDPALASFSCPSGGAINVAPMNARSRVCSPVWASI